MPNLTDGVSNSVQDSTQPPDYGEAGGYNGDPIGPSGYEGEPTVAWQSPGSRP